MGLESVPARPRRRSSGARSRGELDPMPYSSDLDCELTLLSAEVWRQAFKRAGLAVTRQERVLYPLEEGRAPSWKQEVGSLLTLGARPA